MEITDIQVHLVDDVKLKAYVAVILDHCFVVKDLKIIEGNNGLFLAMPNKKGKDGIHRDIAHPINAATRKLFESSILRAYRKKLSESGISAPDESAPPKETNSPKEEK
jgi:stage V sporulation protein G